MKRILAILCMLMTACSDGVGGSKEEVISLRFLADDIHIGESVRVEIEFTSESEVYGDPESSSIAVEVSSALSYDVGSSRIYEDGNDTDDLDEPEVLRCGDGRTFLKYYFDRETLREHNLGSFNYKFRLNLTGERITAAAAVRASARSSQVDCNSDFDDQENDTVSISL